jgi:Tol biopolymer transport system component
MNADGSNLHALTPPELGGNEPSWAPDGNRILFQTYNTYIGDFSQNEEIWSIDPDGSDPKQLTRINDSHRRPYLAAPHDFAPSWAPDGDAIVFERDNGPFTKHSIIVMNARAGSTAAVFNYATRGRNEMRRRVGPLVRRDIGSGAYPRWGAAR